MPDPTPDADGVASAQVAKAAPRRWARLRRRVVLYTLCFFVLLLLAAPFSPGDRLFFFPSRETIRVSTPHGYQQHSLEITASDGTLLHGLLLKPQHRTASALILHLHGNAANINVHANQVTWLCDHGFELMLLDYRGYGQSEGSADIAGVIDDSRAAIRHAHHLAAGRPLIIFGQSLGGGMAQAAYADTSLPLADAIVLESTFASFHSVANSKLGGTPLTKPILWALLSDGEQPHDGAAQIAKMPCMVIHGTRDYVVGDAQGREIVAAIEAVGGKPQHIEIDGVGHLELQRRAEIQAAIVELIESVGGKSSR